MQDNYHHHLQCMKSLLASARKLWAKNSRFSNIYPVYMAAGQVKVSVSEWQLETGVLSGSQRVVLNATQLNSLVFSPDKLISSVQISSKYIRFYINSWQECRPYWI